MWGSVLCVLSALSLKESLIKPAFFITVCVNLAPREHELGLRTVLGFAIPVHPIIFLKEQFLPIIILLSQCICLLSLHTQLLEVFLAF